MTEDAAAAAACHHSRDEELKRGHRKGTVKTMRKLATTHDVDLDDLT